MVSATSPPFGGEHLPTMLKRGNVIIRPRICGSTPVFWILKWPDLYNGRPAQERHIRAWVAVNNPRPPILSTQYASTCGQISEVRVNTSLPTPFFPFLICLPCHNPPPAETYRRNDVLFKHGVDCNPADREPLRDFVDGYPTSHVHPLLSGPRRIRVPPRPSDDSFPAANSHRHPRWCPLRRGP